MAFNEIEQLKQVIKQSHHILIIFRNDYSVDALATATALKAMLGKMNGNSGYGGQKLVDIICDDFLLQPNLKFIKGGQEIKNKLSNLQKFIISLNTGRDNIDEFSYSVDDDKLNIYITPKAGTFDKEKLKAKNSDYKYDLIFTINTPDLESLGKPYKSATEFFYNTTIVNIDHKSDNEQYGQLNFTNLNAVSSSEILYKIISETDESLIDKNISTALLTGMIAETKSFKTPNITPKTLEIASKLISFEADRELIVKSLYRSRKISTLKLWGRTLARLKSKSGNKFIWSVLTENDFIESEASENDLPGVIDELISFIPGVEVATIIYQKNNKNCIWVNALGQSNAMYLTREFKPIGNKKQVKFYMEEKSLKEIEETVIEKIKENFSISQ